MLEEKEKDEMKIEESSNKKDKELDPFEIIISNDNENLVLHALLELEQHLNNNQSFASGFIKEPCLQSIILNLNQCYFNNINVTEPTLDIIKHLISQKKSKQVQLALNILCQANTIPTIAKVIFMPFSLCL